MKNIFAFWIGLSGFSVFAQNDSIPKQLAEISVKANVKITTNKNGNTKIDIANSIYKSVPNAVELLSKLPKILISPDRESISIVGKGNPLVYIDNQKVELNDLNTLDVADIKSIEIISNPSSKYEANGKAVILISRKRSKKEGFKTQISETASFKKKYNNYAGINASLRNKKTEFKANANINHLNPWESNGINYQILPENIASNYRVGGFTKRQQYIFGGGIFHQINDDDCISVNANFRFQPDDFRFSTQTFNSQNNIQNNIKTQGKNSDSRNFINAFANYNKKIKKHNAEFFAGFQYSNYDQESEITSFNNYNDTQFDPFQHRNQDFEIRAFSGRADLEKKFNNGMKFSIGGLFAAANAETGFEMSDFEQQQFTVSDYRLYEKNTAAYSELSGSFRKIAWIAGMRMENTNIHGKYDFEAKPPVDKNYVNFFPKVQVEITIDSTKTVSFNYGKSISRPDYSSTSQSVTYINPYFVFASNINLNPSFSNEVAAVFQYLDKSFRLSYFKNKDVVYYAFSYDSQQNLLAFSPENFKKESGYSLELTLPFSHQFWSSTTMLNLYSNKVEDPRAVLFESKPFLYYYSNHNFALKNNLNFSLTASGMTKRKEGIYSRNDFFILDLAVSKTFFKSISCTLSLNNILKDVTYKENFTINNVTSKAQYFVNTREIALALKYTFGKVKESVQNEKSIEETSRIR